MSSATAGTQPPAGPPLICQLPEAVANQIAAGEVVERPANVVKELVENALDAGATRIAVRIEDGGRRLVEVVDDGHGMEPEGLRLALGRHATSKLRGPEDLFRVATLGFRGEALPSIAAVSECELVSRPHGAAAAHRLQLAGNSEIAWEPCAAAPGTRSTVRNLFWNVPVRLKFLKTAPAEAGRVIDWLHRLALGHPQVAFRLESDGKVLLDLPPHDELLPRIRALFGRQLAEGLLPCHGLVEGAELSGWVARPDLARPSGRRQILLLNGRSVRDRLLTAALREAARSFMEPRMQPVAVLSIAIDPSLVDVNVHPTKTEVRFRRESEIFHLLRGAVRAAFEQHSGSYGLLDTPPGPATWQGGGEGLRRRLVKAPATVTAAPTPAEPAIQERFLPPDMRIDGPAPSTVTGRAEADTSTGRNLQSLRAAETGAPYRSDDETLPPGVRRVIQLRDMWLLIETEHGLRIVDQHALHEKALFLALDPAACGLVGSGRQELLMPLPIELSAHECALVEAQSLRLLECGVEIEPLGPTTLGLRAHPAGLGRVDWPALLRALAAEGPGDDALARLRERILHRRACRAAIKAGDHLGEAECRALVRLLYTVEGLEHCPHGRPTTLDLSWDDLARRFQR